MNRALRCLIDFKKTLKYFDVLVGYFRTSGFHQLCQSFESIDKIRILVGLNVDRKTYETENWKLNVIHDLPTKNPPLKKGENEKTSFTD